MQRILSLVMLLGVVSSAAALQHHRLGGLEADCLFHLSQAMHKPSAPESVLVITEIMYNNPGTDDYEFLEVYNAGDLPLQLEGYRFTTGVTFTFPARILPPGEFVLIAIDSARFRQAFNKFAFQWNAGQGLNNSGELVTLVNPMGEVMDSVRYGIAAPWPAAANGNGPSLQLCNIASDNSLPSSWAASTAGTGFFINGVEVLATPGATNDCSPPPPPVYPIYPIGVVTTENANGVADSLNVRCQLQGVVYGINLRTTGLQFTIIDEQNNGIAVFSATATYGYQVQERDEVIVRGRVSQFNGLTQILPDTVILVSTNRPLLPAATVSQLGEDTESRLVRLENLSIVNPSQWTNTGTGFNVDVSNGVTVFQMRIVSTSNIFGTPPPVGTFHLTGIGGQFDTSLPYTEGYQIFPRYLADIQIISSVRQAEAAPRIQLLPNPVATGKVLVQSTVPFNGLRVTDAQGRVVFFNWFAHVHQFTLDTSAYVPGVYQVSLLDGKRVHTAQLVVR